MFTRMKESMIMIKKDKEIMIKKDKEIMMKGSEDQTQFKVQNGEFKWKKECNGNDTRKRIIDFNTMKGNKDLSE